MGTESKSFGTEQSPATGKWQTGKSRRDIVSSADGQQRLIVKRKSTLRDAQKAHTRQRLLDAARTVFYREGYYGATVDQVVAEAGASRPTFYLHFKDKGEMLAELMTEYMKRAVPYMERLPGPKPTVDELEAWLLEIGKFLGQEEALYAVLGEVSTHRPSDHPQNYGLTAVDVWIKALGARSAAFTAAASKANVVARARAEILIIEIVWAGGNVLRNKLDPFTKQTVLLVAQSLHDFINDSRLQISERKVKNARAASRPAVKKTRPSTRAG